MRDVAAAAGLSDATVSLALRDHARIPEATRARVREAAARLGYRADPAVRRLMVYLRGRQARRTREVIAVVSAFPTERPWETNPHLALIYRGLVERAQAAGLEVEPYWLAKRGLTAPRLGAILRARGIGEVIFLGLPQVTPTLDFPWRDFAATTIGHSLQVPLHRVAQHHHREMGIVLETLAAKGYRRPGLVLNPDVDARVDRHYRAAYLVAQAERAPRVRLEPWAAEGGRAGFVRWFNRTRPDAIVVGQAPPGLRELKTWMAGVGAPCPERTALVSLDVREGEEPCSGIVQAYPQLAAAAVDVVNAQRLRGERGLPAHPRLILLAGAWREGGTTPGRAKAEG